MKRSSIVTALVVILGILALGHLAVYRVLILLWDISALTETQIVFAILTISFVAMSLITMKHYSKTASFFYTLAAAWLGTLYWLFIASVFSALILFVSQTSHTSILVGKILFLSAIVTSVYGIINSNKTRVTRYTTKLDNLPESWHGKRIAIASDLHLGSVRGKAFTEKIVRMINAENPEMVLLAGDFFDGPKAPYVKFASPLKDIQAPRGIYFSQGNHEEFQASTVYDEALAAAGVQILSNKKTVVEGVEIIGINYNVSHTDTEAADVLSTIGVSSDIPSILIKHAPTGLTGVAQAGVNLQVSGHTHQGQTWPFHIITQRIFGKFEYGMHAKDTLTVITSSGAGTWGPMQRIGTHSEIVIVTLETT